MLSAVRPRSVQYMQQPERVFAEIYRVLKPGGVVIVTFSNRLFYNKVRRWEGAAGAAAVSAFHVVPSPARATHSSGLRAEPHVPHALLLHKHVFSCHAGLCPDLTCSVRVRVCDRVHVAEKAFGLIAIQHDTCVKVPPSLPCALGRARRAPCASQVTQGSRVTRPCNSQQALLYRSMPSP